MDHVRERAQSVIDVTLKKYDGSARSEMKRRLIIANPFLRAGSPRHNEIYVRACRRALDKIYCNGESGKTLFSFMETEAKQ